MITRIWRGTTAAADAGAYGDYIERTGGALARSAPGNRGVYILRRVSGEEAEFLFVSLWETLEDARRFAGGDLERAVYFPEDRRFLREMPETVAHYEVI